MVSVTDPFGAVTKYAYDGAHRCTEVMNPDGSRVSYAYDGAGEVASMHVAKPGERLGRLACEWVRDRAGRCLTVKDYLAGENLARLGAQRSAAATVATATTAVGSANASATTAAGRSSIGVSDGVESEADVYVQTTYVSDALGRLVKVDSAPQLGDEVSDTAFFAVGNRVSAAGDASAAEVFASTGAWSLAYSYDADGNVVQRTTPYGSTVYGYSPGGRVRSTQQVPAGIGVEGSSSVGDKPGVAEFAYDALGYLERVQVGECVSSWVRDTSGAVMGYTEEVLGGADEPGGSSSGVVQSVRVRRNPAGKITRVEDTVKGSWCEYAYDASGRLIRAVSSDDVSVVWVYDPVGLLMREETHQEGTLVRVRAFSYAGERVQTVRLYEALEDGGGSSAAPVAGVVEDLTGLDTSSLVCTGSVQYSYDVRGFRTGAADHTGAAVTWGWDALGSLERVERINHSSDSLLGSHLSAASDGNSTVWFAASSVRNMPVAVGSQQNGQDPVVSPLVWDTTVPDAASLVGVGVTEAVSAGSVLGGRDSILTGTGMGAYGFGTDIFGVASPVTWGSNTTAAAGNGLPGLPADVGLTDQGALATVGGELMGARLYDPVTAGFLSPDPVEPVAGSGYMGASYLFASGDPVNLHDPTGLQPIPAEAMRKYAEYIESDDFIRDFDRAMAEETKRHWDGFWSVDGWKKSLEELQKDPGRWFNDHGKDVLAGVVFVGGLLLMIPQATRGVGGAIVTSMLFSAVLQKWEYGDLNPDQLTFDGLLGGITAAAIVLYLQRMERLQSMSGVTLRLEATQLSINAPRWGSKAPKKFSIQDFFAGGFFKSQEAAPLTGLYRDGAEGARTVNELRRLRYPKVEIEVKPVAGAGGARSATEVPPVAVSRVDVPQVAPVEGSGASRGASQVPVKPVEAPQVGEVPPASGAGSGAAGMQAVKPGGVADDAVAARGSAGGVREPEVQLKPVEEPKVENLPPAKGAASDSTALENPVTADRHVSWTEHPPGSTVQNGDQTITYLDAADFKSALATGTKDSSRYVPAEEPGTYNVYGFDEARLVKDDYYKKLKGQDSPADLSKGEPKFALWRPEVSEPNLDTAMTGFRNVTRHGNTVEAQVGNHKFMVTNLDEYTGTIPDDVVPTAKSIYEDGEVYWKNKDHKPEGFGNVPAPLPFNNKEARILPTHDYAGNEIDYTKYKVRRRSRVSTEVSAAGKERLIVGSDGSMYYTPDHYETFVRIL